MKPVMRQCLRFLTIASVLTIIVSGNVVSHSSVRAPGGQAEPQPVLTLSGDAAIVTFLIEPDQITDFEMALSRLKVALQENVTPRREQSGAWALFKSHEMIQGKTVYMLRIDRVSTSEAYDIPRLIAEVFPMEVQDLFLKYQ